MKCGQSPVFDSSHPLLLGAMPFFQFAPLRRRLPSRAGIVLMTVLTLACGSGGEITPVTPPPPTARVNAVSVSPANATVVSGSSTSFTASVDVTGSASTTVTWSASNPAAVTLNSSGNTVSVTAVLVPTAPVTITATSVGDPTKSGSATLTIAAPPSYTLQLTPPAQSVTAGASVGIDVTLANVTNFTGSVTLSFGTVTPGINGTFQPPTITPGQTSRLTLTTSASLAAGAASVEVRGDAPALTTRSATLALTARGAASVRLSAPDSSLDVGQTVRVTPVVRDAANNVLTGRAVSWSSTQGTVASVDGTGFVRALAPGTTFIRATVDGVVDSLPIVVNAPVASVRITVPDSQLVQGQVVQATIIARDAGGTVIGGRPVTYLSNAASVASVSSAGVITAGNTLGFATITATVDGVSAQLSIEVIARVATVVVQATPSFTITVGQFVQLQAIAGDQNGQVLNGRTVSWTSSDTTIATVSPTTGRVDGKRVGTATITATVDGVSGSGVVTVIAPVASVQVTGARNFVRANETLQLTATPRDAGGNPIAGLSVVWSTNSQVNGRVSAFGAFTGVAVGPTTVTATVNGVAGTLDLCTAFSHSTNGATTTGASAGICSGSSYLAFTTPASGYYVVSASFNSALSFTPLGTSRGFPWSFTWQIGASFAFPIVVPPGTWATKFTGTGSFSYRVDGSAPQCGRVMATYNVTNFPIPLSTGCSTVQPSGLPTGTYYGSEIYMPELRPGETITVTASSPTLTPVIELFDRNGNRLETTITQTGATQTLSFTRSPTSAATAPRVVVSTRVSGLASGTITVSITGPSSLGL